MFLFFSSRVAFLKIPVKSFSRQIKPIISLLFVQEKPRLVKTNNLLTTTQHQWKPPQTYTSTLSSLAMASQASLLLGIFESAVITALQSSLAKRNTSSRALP